MSSTPASTTPHWLSWNEVARLMAADETGDSIQVGDHLLKLANESEESSAFLKAALPEICSCLSAQYAALYNRSPQWKPFFEFGRDLGIAAPVRQFEESLDQNAVSWAGIESADDWSSIIVPLGNTKGREAVLLLVGRSFEKQSHQKAVALGRLLEYCWSTCIERQQRREKAIRLQGILEVTSAFSTVHETEPLLNLIAEESTRLLDCDRASIFVWDREHKQMVACPALGVDGGTLRLPDNVGVVGEVLSTGQPIRVDDAYEDARFHRDVDNTSGYSTKNLLCWPLKDPAGELIGAFEVLNKNDGVFTVEDEDVITHLASQAAVALLNAQEHERLLRSSEHMTEEVKKGVQLIGESPSVSALRETISRLAETDLPVLILGESGTGKEVVSQALHFWGPRSDRPFVAVNCAALTETLLESELFGHEKGAFTDAHDTRVGKFELAEGGTLFLDEIGDMSLGGQAKLLRVLEQKVVTRVGGSEAIPINVRIVAATNAKLVTAVRERKFREDLYYRLGVVTQSLPPLRERPEDILVLAEYFLKQFCTQANRRPLKISVEARRRLQAHTWPGNIRELRNLMERVAFLSAGERVEIDDLAFILSPEKESASADLGNASLADATKAFQQKYIASTIKRVKGNMSEAARVLELHRSNLYRKMRQLEMSDEISDDDV